MNLACVPAQPGEGEPNVENDVKLCIRMGRDVQFLQPSCRNRIFADFLQVERLLCGQKSPALGPWASLVAAACEPQQCIAVNSSE